MNIGIAEYSENWKKQFEDEREMLFHTFRDEAKAIEHIGSTSIPGQSAKPVIDIFIAVSPFRDVSFYDRMLHVKNYRQTATDIPGRYLFSKYNNDNIRTRNLHILSWDNEFYSRNEILFRDYLRSSPELVNKYNDLKKQLALKNYNSMEEYTKAKTEFVQEVIDLARIERELPGQNVWTMEYIKDDE
jgi:GrpB-like predicted nucleotidyltransferase (UPF0157 family)